MREILLHFEKIPYRVVRQFAEIINAEIVYHFGGYADLEKVNLQVPEDNRIIIDFHADNTNYVPFRSTLLSEDKERGIRIYEKHNERKDGKTKKRYYLVYLRKPITPQLLYEVYMECMDRFND